MSGLSFDQCFEVTILQTFFRASDFDTNPSGSIRTLRLLPEKRKNTKICIDHTFQEKKSSLSVFMSKRLICRVELKRLACVAVFQLVAFYPLWITVILALSGQTGYSNSLAEIHLPVGGEVTAWTWAPCATSEYLVQASIPREIVAVPDRRRWHELRGQVSVTDAETDIARCRLTCSYAMYKNEGNKCDVSFSYTPQFCYGYWYTFFYFFFSFWQRSQPTHCQQLFANVI